MLDDSEATLHTLHALRALGIRIALDDFGTGYSSLSYLRSFPFDKIKIDQSFVRQLSTRPDCIKIIASIADLGMSFGMTTTAEGVETEPQRKLLHALDDGRKATCSPLRSRRRMSGSCCLRKATDWARLPEWAAARVPGWNWPANAAMFR